MKAGIKSICVALFVVCGASGVARAQQAEAAGQTAAQAAGETRVALGAEAVALDAEGRAALAARLRTTQLSGSVEAPARNSRFVLENRSAQFYNYVTGWATFYDTEGVRCGEGLWKAEALAPRESAEVDTPGLRLTCAPATWRIVATSLLTRTSDAAKPASTATNTTPQDSTATSTQESAAPASSTTSPPTTSTSALPPLEININGKTLPLQPGNPLEITVGKERVRIVVSPAP